MPSKLESPWEDSPIAERMRCQVIPQAFLPQGPQFQLKIDLELFDGPLRSLGQGDILCAQFSSLWLKFSFSLPLQPIARHQIRSLEHSILVLNLVEEDECSAPRLTADP